MSAFEVYGGTLPDEPIWAAEPLVNSSAIDGLGLTAPATSTRISLPERLRQLSRFAATSPGLVYMERDTEDTIHRHLDVVENMLRDPRPELTQEIGKYRRRNSDTRSIASDASDATVTTSSAHGPDDGFNHDQILAQLTTLLGEVTALNSELDRRRQESIEIRDLFEEKCRGLTRTVAELEGEMLELQADLVEDAVELEGIQGTVHGLHDWIDNVCKNQKINQISRHTTRQTSRRRWRREEEHETSADTDWELMLEGLSAWMRGWRDVEEGFQVRARARKTRRERRQEQLARSG
ncbi:hypothetical protein N7462_007969 [Penicillium macrosclerotiorum]|uniref:uncharacterized protein n=1 Tax=Penicillium macrosclerotiorum TaxID=303699 RepID=UPI002547EE18|nr:uncharacterized protein N7462_007969 [Penicillium macrosclerotiorum]KAJ5679725.1 hypothetical protein N7462_007969 [Penicillium macrosclerotiorum]